MRILHLTTFLQGGAGLAITTLAAGQARAGHLVTVVTSGTGAPGYGNYPEYLDALRAAGVGTHVTDSLFDRRPEAHQPVDRLIDGELGGAAAFDVLHTHAGVPSAIARRAVARAGRRVPIVQTMHGWGIGKTADQVAHDVAAMNAVDRVVVPARSAADLLAALGVARDRTAIVPYGVARAVPALGADPAIEEMRAWRRAGDLVACCVGTIGPRKNQALLIEALAHLAPPRRVRAVFVGDGPDGALRARAEALGLWADVRFLGYRPDARRVMRAADCLVLPSQSEGQPLAVLEAFCDGVPVFASRIPELRELLDEGRTGWLFDPDDAGGLAVALTSAARAPEELRAMAARARAMYETRFTTARMVAGYLNEYARVS